MDELRRFVTKKWLFVFFRLYYGLVHFFNAYNYLALIISILAVVVLLYVLSFFPGGGLIFFLIIGLTALLLAIADGEPNQQIVFLFQEAIDKLNEYETSTQKKYLDQSRENIFWASNILGTAIVEKLKEIPIVSSTAFYENVRTARRNLVKRAVYSIENKTVTIGEKEISRGEFLIELFTNLLSGEFEKSNQLYSKIQEKEPFEPTPAFVLNYRFMRKDWFKVLLFFILVAAFELVAFKLKEDGIIGYAEIFNGTIAWLAFSTLIYGKIHSWLINRLAREG